MKKLRNMKKNNKGFSLVELIVVIAIMVVLIAVLGSTILGYVDKSKHSKDITALDSVNTAVKAFVAEPNSVYNSGEVYTLADIMSADMDKGGVVKPILAEVFATSGDFNNSSEAFSETTTSSVLVYIKDGAVSIYVPVKDGESYSPYKAGTSDLSNKKDGDKF